MRCWAAYAAFMVRLEGGQTSMWIMSWVCPRPLGRSLGLVPWPLRHLSREKDCYRATLPRARVRFERFL